MSDKIVLAHGGGGALMRELIEGVIAPAIGGLPDGLPDASPIPGADGLVLTTDSFVVKPLFFRGGDIGRLSVFGTVNDLAVSGAEPLALSLSLIVEEGLDIAVLRRVVESAAQAARECGVRIVTGDTKVVARGEADELFVTTAGVGSRRTKDALPGLREGDAVLVSGGIAEHGIAVVSEREGMQFETPVESDAASVWPLVRALIDAGVEIHAMRDPTRGGLAAALNEFARASGVGISIDEQAVPIPLAVNAACELLGLDPFYVANEGKLIAVVPESVAGPLLEAMQNHPRGRNAAIIGRVVADHPGVVVAKTGIGGSRVIDTLVGEQLPRIC